MDVVYEWIKTTLGNGDPSSLVFALCMGVVLLAPLIAGRLRIPGLVGLLVAGMLLGPNAFAVLERDSFIERLGDIGLLFILGLAGLELDLHEFKRHRSSSLLFGCVSFLIPQSLGTGVGLLLDLGWAGSLLLGSIFASHTLLAYPAAKRLGIHGRDPVVIAVGATMVTDTAALLVLAGVAGALSGDGLGFSLFAELGSGFIIFLAFTFFVLPRIAGWALRSLGTNPPAEFLLILALLFFGAWLSSLAGVASMVGAFMTGLSLNRLVPDQSTLMNRVQFVGNTIFIPFFLFSVGMLIDFSALLNDGKSWVYGLIMLLTVFLGKGIASLVGGKILNLGWVGSVTTFGLTLSQAAATLAVVLVGKEILGVFDQAIFNGSLIMIFGSCILAGFITERYGRALAQSSPIQSNTGDLPQRLLVPLANPATVDAIMALTLLLRDKGSIEPVSPLVVVRDAEGVENRVSEGERLLSHAVVHAVAAEVTVTPLIRVDTNVASAMVRAAKELRISTIIIGWQGEVPPGERIFGSILDQVLEEAAPRIAVSRLVRPAPGCKRLILAVPPYAQLEPGFRRSLSLVRNMSQQLGLPLELWCVGEDIAEEIKQVIAPKDQLPINTRVEGSWTKVRHHLVDDLTSDDMVILLSAREGGVSWQPGFDRLPRIVATRHPQTNLVVLFAPLPNLERHQHETATQASGQHPAVGIDLFPRLVLRAIQSPQWQEAVATLADMAPLEVAQRRAIALELISDAKRESLLLAPNVVMLHAHSREISQSTLLVGNCEEPVVFPKQDDGVKVVIVLISRSKQGHDHQLHLRRLASLAKLARNPQAMDELAQATNDEELRTVFKNI